MLHIFLSNRPGDVRYGTTGKPVPGYDVKLVGDDGEPVSDGEEGSLWVRGPTACAGYWNQRERSLGHVPRPVDAHRRSLRPRRRRLLHLLRPLRRHAQGGRHLGVAVRGRERARLARRGARSGRGRHARRRWPGQAEGVRRAQAGTQRRRDARRRAQALRRRSSSRPTSIRAGSSSSPSCQRRRPARSSATSCADRARGRAECTCRLRRAARRLRA